MNDEQHREKVEQFLDHTHTRGGDVKYPELPASFEWIYEFSSPTGGVHRKMTPAQWNGRKSTKQYLVYTADQMRSYADATCALRGAQKESGWIDLTDEDRERAFRSMPDMLEGFMKTWGWLHFAKAIEAACREKNQQGEAK